MNCNHCGKPAKFASCYNDGRLPLCSECLGALHRECPSDSKGYISLSSVESNKRAAIVNVDRLRGCISKLSPACQMPAMLLLNAAEADVTHLINLHREVMKCGK